ncbi:MAG: hypothetical protein EBQ89_09295, partial [Alphaproteobacteria bacterium]|nr:hypothetical protein [Alphaproteobacteria bacterium]
DAGRVLQSVLHTSEAVVLLRHAILRLRRPATIAGKKVFLCDYKVDDHSAVIRPIHGTHVRLCAAKQLCAAKHHVHNTIYASAFFQST